MAKKATTRRTVGTQRADGIAGAREPGAPRADGDDVKATTARKKTTKKKTAKKKTTKKRKPAKKKTTKKRKPAKRKAKKKK